MTFMCLTRNLLDHRDKKRHYSALLAVYVRFIVGKHMFSFQFFFLKLESGSKFKQVQIEKIDCG